METIQVPVLIVGGGPVGLSAALGLTRHGVPWLLVERRSERTTVQPRARGIKVRTMEVLRAWGVEDAVEAAGLPPEKRRFSLWVRSLAGEELARTVMAGFADDTAALSPARGSICGQDALEPILLAAAQSDGVGEARFGVDLTAFEQDERGIVATLEDHNTRRDVTVRAHYLVAADGAESPIRQRLDIAMPGPVGLAHHARIIFRADLGRLVAGRESVTYWIDQPDLAALLLAINQTDRWELSVPFRPERGERIEDFTVDRCVTLARKVAGISDLAVEILAVGSFAMTARVADRFRAGRVFLVGDAAHEMPPTGAYGMNTGIQDAHNLAWKLAAVHHGWAHPALLESYEAERLPVARRTVEQARRNTMSLDAPAAASGTQLPRGLALDALDDNGLVLGTSYVSGAVVPDGTEPPTVENPLRDYVPNARPGSRAPHVWLFRDGRRVSTLDLFRTSFVLLAGPDGQAWCKAARQHSHEIGRPLHVYRIGATGNLVDPEGAWGGAYGVFAGGAVLVRPDGYVAWRARGRQPDQHAAVELQRAIIGICGSHTDIQPAIAAATTPAGGPSAV